MNVQYTEDINFLKNLFKKRKKKIFISFFINFFIILISLAIVGLKLFYPYHFIIGIFIYIISYAPLIYGLFVARSTFKKFGSYKFAKNYYLKRKKRLALIIFVILSTMSFFTIRPVDDNTLANIENRGVTALVNRDLEKAVVVMDYLETSGEELLQSLNVEQPSTSESEKIRNDFNKFVESIILVDSLTDVHSHFDSISRFGMSQERAYSFIITYSLYAKKYEIVHRIMTEVSNDELKKKLLNEYVDLMGTGNLYQGMISRYYSPKTRLRMNAGKIYLELLYHDVKFDDINYIILHKKARESYAYLFSNFDKTVINSAEISSDYIENKMFDAWFPIQKNVANTMGHIIFMDRKDSGFITIEQARNMAVYLNPGDIMLQRRNWHLSNVGIPGFWTHAVLYTGTLDDMENYFADIFPYENYSTVAEYIEDNFPDVYKKYTTKDENNYDFAVIEAIEPGVILQSIEKTTRADFIVALRPQLLNKKDKFLAISRAFENFGKPYDYDFDFETRDELVCSELVYDAYLPIGSIKNGLNFPLTIKNGRKMVSPLDIANKYSNERNTPDSELNFVYFLRGDEKTQTASVSDEAEFIESLNWSKFTFNQ